ncbi:hypothetical protein [Roseiflexus sp. RS-1]|uniref:hypothetical protein n=1 Tax=Roseiflexus sp. (strain RS-1) TaxID=357808 RepID=UPI0000D7FC8D|nr:hypothetical protein [Roseiflexus sp. RS-1]ABQ92742.1 Tetratricopeptide TPR_2 repeat protein [Roseiflexus sp. RS-1]
MPFMTTTNDLLQQGIAAARSGQRALARQLFVRVIQADQYNDEAWVWLAGVVDDPADMRRCLQQALRINPLNPHARQGIAWLDQQARQAQKTSSSAGAPPDGQASSVSPSSMARPTPSQEANQPPQASSDADRGLFQLPPATNGPSPASQSSASAKPASARDSRLSDSPASAAGKTSADGTVEKPARRFSLFGKPKPTPAAAAPSDAPRPANQPARRFALFGKPKPAADAPAPASDAPRPANQPARRFAFFGKPEPAADAASAAPAPNTAQPTDQPARRFALFSKPKPTAAAMVATAAAGAAGATMTAPVATPAPKSRRKEKELPPEEGDPTRDRCPYCGELNKPDRAWCRRCDRSLMIRGPARAQRSPWLSILGILWVLGGVLGILGAIAGLIGALVLYNSVRGSLSDFPLIIVVVCVIIALVYGGQIAIARAMLNRARWAYWIIAVLTALQLGGSLLGALGAAATIRDAIAQAQALLPSSEAATAAAAVTGIFGTVVLIDVGIKAFFMLLVGLSWRDFYGPKERFVSEVHGSTDYELFNTGLALQRKGMWWMAMKQWEAAVANSPRDTDYLHALTVAYAKLGEWEKARETIAKAIKVAPDNPALKQVQERIERTIAAQG